MKDDIRFNVLSRGRPNVHTLSTISSSFMTFMLSVDSLGGVEPALAEVS